MEMATVAGREDPPRGSDDVEQGGARVGGEAGVGPLAHRRPDACRGSVIKSWWTLLASP
jgi:hypothetical protein